MYDNNYDNYEDSLDLYDKCPIVYGKIDMGETFIYYGYWRDYGFRRD